MVLMLMLLAKEKAKEKEVVEKGASKIQKVDSKEGSPINQEKLEEEKGRHVWQQGRQRWWQLL